ncbi:MAG: DUF1080 domain-containing protein [Pirellulales bacterium]|nr:DUF1080 domain-containing protein [Pirellulales bacterium]
MRLSLAVSLSLALTASLPAAGDIPGVKLMRPDSLAGWTYGEKPPAGWTISEGKLHGCRDSTPLLSGFSAADGEQRFDWSATAEAAWRILMPEVPAGSGLELVLREGEHCAQLKDGPNVIAPGAKVGPAGGRMHTAAIRRAEGKLAVAIDGRRLYEVEIAPARRFALGLAVLGAEASLANLRAAEPAGKPLFNGKDFSGWWTPGNLGAWTVEEGELVLAHPGSGNYLRTETQFANFTLSFSYKMAKGGNSGVGIRTPRAGWPSGDGMEMQFWDRPDSEKLDKHQTMAIYGNVPPLARFDRSEDWNHVVVKADGPMVSAWVNGELVQQVNTLQHPELKHRHPQGWIGFQDHNDKIRIRDVRVLEAPPGPGLEAWRRPLPATGETVVLDRLMNPERLSVPEAVRSGVACRSIAADNSSEHVLAELAGPGAVVRVARSSDEGDLAFYFDGEDRPRLECKPADLWHAGTEISEDTGPVLTFLGYEKSLRIVLRNARNADYRIEYLRFPAGIPVTTFDGAGSGFPHGWLSAVNYRHEQFDWGVHRENDPRPRFGCEPRTIQPGRTEVLVHVPGTGIVHWTKLLAAKTVLADNDLWLEATVDGESQPAVSAPARYWFPLFAGNSDNPHGFILVDRGGPTNMLAMPFGEGITISARNCGKKPVPGIGFLVSVEPATDANREAIKARMRLRGVFQPASGDGNLWIEQAGRGRWVALVYQQPEGRPRAVDSLEIDGHPAEGWRGGTLDLFFGQAGDFRKCLSGRNGNLAWRYLILAPVEFERSLVLKSSGDKLGERLALFYVRH